MAPPIVNAIIIIFIIVPNPGLSFNGIQKTKTMQLIIKVEKPIPILTLFATPSAKTVHGVTPFWETTKILSPKPNKNKPKQRNRNVSNLGKIIFGFCELQDVIGTELIKKALEINPSADLIILIILRIISELYIRSI